MTYGKINYSKWNLVRFIFVDNISCRTQHKIYPNSIYYQILFKELNKLWLKQWKIFFLDFCHNFVQKLALFFDNKSTLNNCKTTFGNFFFSIHFLMQHSCSKETYSKYACNCNTYWKCWQFFNKNKIYPSFMPLNIP